MYKFLFKNRLAAVAFVLITLLSVKMLIGNEGEESVLSRTQDDLVAQRAGMQDSIDSLSMAQEVQPEFEAVEEVMPDEELIDDAEGFDPTPADGEDDFAEDDQADASEDF